MAKSDEKSKGAHKPAVLKRFAAGCASQEQFAARLSLDPAVVNAVTAMWFSKANFGDIDVTELVKAMEDSVAPVRAGDLSGIERMLITQASALNSIFGEMARRSALNIGEYIKASETFMRLALKAQAQCRATLETLAAIKNPVIFARQANIANGPQQVNNGVMSVSHAGAGARASAENSEMLPNELLEAGNATSERLDGGAPGKAIGGDPALASMGAVQRSLHG